MRSPTLLAILGAGLSSAHTIFVSLEVNGVDNGVGYGIRDPSYDGPQTDVTSNSMACNGPPNPTTPSNKTITITAGSQVTAIWRRTLTSGPTDVMDPSHLGPVLAYMKKVTDALTDPGYGPGWFKIQEDGLDNGTWATSKVINDQGEQVITIPSCIENGQYLLRPEMIALHAASTYPGAQFYMECAQVIVTGGTGSATPTTYSIPGIYKGSDPGITIDIYYPPVTNYTIPGPPVFTC